MASRVATPKTKPSRTKAKNPVRRRTLKPTSVESPPVKASIRILSSLPMRERWQVDAVRRKAHLSATIQADLLSQAGVAEAEVNAMSGRVLLLYSAPSQEKRGEYLIAAALERAHALRPVLEANEGGRVEYSLLRLVMLARPKPKLVYYAAGAAVLSTLSNFVIAWCSSSLLGAVAGKGQKKKLGPWTYGAITAVTSIAAVVIRHYQSRFWKLLATDIEHKLRVRTFAHLEQQDMAYFDAESTGALMNTLSADLSSVARFLETGPGTALESATVVVVAVGLLLTVAPGIALICVLPMACVFFSYRYAQRSLGPKYAMMGQRTAELNGLLTNNLAGIATVKSFTAETYETERVRSLSDAARRSHVSAADAGSAYGSLLGGIYGTAAALSMALGGEMVETGSLSSGAFLTMAQLVPRLMSAMGSVNDLYDLYQNASASAARVLKVLDREPMIRTGAKRLSAPKVRGEIVFRDVRFGYQAGHEVLKGLDLEIAAGQTIGIVGATGAGKTTLAKLLLRFYDADGGTVTIDGNDVRDLTLADLRGAVAFVSQDVYLFDGTVKDNILYGRPDASLEEVIAAARAAEADGFIQGLPLGYDSPVGERGARLSTGQRQRISIARAILKDAPVLVLDEATASVDNETEAAIHRSIERLEAGRSMMIIAHRLSTVRNADRIYVLEGGRVLEQGLHDELLARKGLYASLWSVQTGATRGSGANSV